MNKQIRPLKISIDASRINTVTRTGIENYTYNIINAISKIDTTNNYTLFFKEKPSPEFISHLTGNNPKFTYKTLKQGLSWTQLRLAYALWSNTYDILFAPFHTVPVFKKPQIKYISMIHGLEYTYTQGFQNDKYLQKLKTELPFYITSKMSDHIITPSIATKDKIISKGWANKSKIDVVKEGVNNSFYKRTISEIDKVRLRYKIADPYILFVSTIQPRKNVYRLIEAFAKLIVNQPNYKDLKLVISGKPGWDYQEILQAPKNFGVENSVIFVGRTSDEDLPVLLSGADFYINPSLEEGFGLPVLEAMACETLCLLSDIDAFKEVAKNNAFYFDPLDTNDISQVMQEALVNKNKYVELIQKAKVSANQLTWEKTAKETLQIFSEISNI